jgi:hypothetical protein
LEALPATTAAVPSCRLAILNISMLIAAAQNLLEGDVLSCATVVLMTPAMLPLYSTAAVFAFPERFALRVSYQDSSNGLRQNQQEQLLPNFMGDSGLELHQWIGAWWTLWIIVEVAISREEKSTANLHAGRLREARGPADADGDESNGKRHTFECSSR